MLNHSRSFHFTFFFLAALFLVNATSISAVTLPRIAIMPADNETSSSTLADLISVELSSQDSVQVVERSEIDRVLKEQDMSAEGLTDVKSRIALGKLLKADGFLFLEKSAKDDRVSARLVETVQGFQVGYVFYPTEKTSAEALAKSISADTLKLIPKLSLDPSKRKLVSIIRIGNATLSPDYFWIEDELPALLGSYFSQDPSILVLERRQLGDLLDEAKVSGQPSEFRAGGILIDGEIALRNWTAKTSQSPQVCFTIRIRDADLRELARLSTDGDLTKIDDLISKTADAVLQKLRTIGADTTKATATESKLFMDLATRQGFLWAAESAYALSSTNKEATYVLANSLVLEATQSDPILHSEDDVLVRAEMRKKAMMLSRSMTLCRESGISFRSIAKSQRNRLSTFLANDRTKLDKETRELLKPIRQIFRINDEESLLKHNHYRPLAWQARAFFDNPLDFFTYVSWLLDDILHSTSLAKDERVCKASELLFAQALPPQFYQNLPTSDSPQIRMFGWMKLSSSTSITERKRECSRQALCLLDSIVDSDTIWSGIQGPAFQNAFLDVVDTLPEERAHVASRLIAKFNSALDNNDLQGFVSLAPDAYFSLFAPEEIISLIDRAIELNDRDMGTDRELKNASNYFSLLKTIRAELIEKYNIRSTTAPLVDRRVILSADSQKWKAVAGNISRRYDRRGMPLASLTPQRILLEEDTLWVALGCDWGWDGNATHAVGLLAIDLHSGHIKSLQFGTFAGGPTDTASSLQFPDGKSRSYPCITSIRRLNDFIYVGHWGVGVHVFPAQSAKISQSLEGVQRLDESNGLIDRRVNGLATIDRELFIGLPTALMKWNPEEQKLTVVVNLKSETKNAPADIKEIWTMLGNQSGKHIYVLQNYMYPHVKIWRFTPSDKSWKQLSFGKTDVMLVNTVFSCPHEIYASSWGCKGSSRGRIIHNLLFRFNAEKEQAVLLTEPNCRLFVSPETFIPEYDIVNYKGGSITTTGWGPDWKLLYFSDRQNSNALEWAPLVQPQQTSMRSQDKTEAAMDSEAKEQHPLIEASAQGNTDMIAILLSKGDNINTQDEKGWTPLIHAISSNRTDAAMLLLDKGADVNLRTLEGCSPLGFAAARGNLEIARNLIERNADVRNISVKGLTPIYSAAYNGHFEIAKLLISHGADVNKGLSVGDQWTPIFAAATRGYISIVKLLLDNGVPVDQKERRGRTVLMESAFRPHPEVLELLIKHGANISAHDSNRATAMVAAISSGSAQNVRLLAEHGMDIHSPMPSERGKTPLMHAAANSTPEVVQCLINLGAKVNAKTSSGDTALLYATMNNQLENIRVLLHSGADVTTKYRGTSLTGGPGGTYSIITAARSPEARALLREAIGKKRIMDDKTP